MKLTILVTAHPLQNTAARNALQFARMAIAKRHAITRVFFRGDGVYNADTKKEINLVVQWSELHQQTNVDLVLCSTDSMRRGIREINLAPGFRISGIGQLIDAIDRSERTITFG